VVWLIPFVVGMAAFPIMETQHALFETIVAVAMAATAAWTGARFIRRAPQCNWRHALRLGLMWMAISLVLDAGFFSWGPQAMGLWQYLGDIGFTYLMIPAITTAMGWVVDKNGR
jgi:hypothetical protein